jgi:hypothetical protein
MWRFTSENAPAATAATEVVGGDDEALLILPWMTAKSD